MRLPYWNYDRFILEDMTDEECTAELRVRKSDIYQVCASLNLPHLYRCYNRLEFDSVEALCVCLKRFACPCRYADLVPRF